MNAGQGALGVVLPSNNTVLMDELRTLLPGSELLERSVQATGSDSEALLRMSLEADEAVSRLEDADLIAYACASTGYARGARGDKEFMTQLSGRSSRPCFSAAHAGVEAMRARGAKRIALLTPYPPDIHQLVAPYYAAHGIEVVDDATLDIPDIDAVGGTSPELIRQAVLGLRHDVDAIGILATDLPTLAIHAELEAELGIPVITTNQAIAWYAGRVLDGVDAADQPRHAG